MQLKNILFSLVSIVFYAPFILSRQNDKASEPDHLYTVQIDEDFFYLKEKEQKTIFLNGTKHTISIQSPTTKVFENTGIYFKYPVKMSCIYDKEGNDQDVKIWDIKGSDTYLMIHKYFNKKNIWEAYIMSITHEFAKENQKIQRKNISSRGKKYIKGVLFKIQSGDTKIVQEVYLFKASDNYFIITLQDVRDDFDKPTAEFQVMKNTFFSTVKMH